MTVDQKALEKLIAKEEIRELALLYSRGVDRKDAALLRSLYAAGATDTHGNSYDGDAEGYVSFLEANAFPHLHYSGHHICNHLINVDGDSGDGEVYALAYHVFRDRQGAWVEDLIAVRYIDRYCREHGRWRFAQRVVSYDMRSIRPVSAPDAAMAEPGKDPSYAVLTSRLFARGARA